MSRLFVVLTLSLLAGCATPLPTLPAPSGPPGPHLALAPVLVTAEPTASRPKTLVVKPFERKVCVSCEEEQPVEASERSACVDCGYGPFRRVFDRPYVPDLDLEGLTERVAGTLRERQTFEQVTTLTSEDANPRVRTQKLLEEAREQGAEWLLELKVERLELDMLELNGWHVPKVITFVVCAVLIFPAVDPPNWFIPGEDYGVVAAGRWQLRDVETGVLKAQGRIKRELCRDSFAAFGLGGIPSREFFVAGFLRVPGCLEEEHWAEIGQKLKPAADLGLSQALVREAEALRSEGRD